jgi:hypothetical protein
MLEVLQHRQQAILLKPIKGVTDLPLKPSFFFQDAADCRKVACAKIKCETPTKHNDHHDHPLSRICSLYIRLTQAVCKFTAQSL